MKASSLDSEFHLSQFRIDFQEELTTHPNLAPNQPVGQELTAHDLNDAFGSDWYDHCDSVVKNLHQSFLHRVNFPESTSATVIGYIHCMTKRDRQKQVCWSPDNHVKEFLRSIRKVGKELVSSINEETSKRRQRQII